MGIEKPTGGHAEQMLDPGAWPDVDEDVFYDRATEFTRVLQRVAAVMETCQQQQARVFDGGIWSGGAADAANGEFSSNINLLMDLQSALAGVVTWHKYVAGSVVQAKSTIGDNVDEAERHIKSIQHDSSMDDDERKSAINKVINATHGANLGVVAGIADQIRATTGWRAPENALDDLLDQKMPPDPEAEEEGNLLTLSGPPAQLAPPAPAPASSDASVLTLNGLSAPGGISLRPTPAAPPAAGAPAAPAAGSDPAETVLSPAASGVLPGSSSSSRGEHKGVAPAAVSTLSEEALAPSAPAAAGGLPPASMAPAAAAGAAAASGGAPAGSKSSGGSRNTRSAGSNTRPAAAAATTTGPESADRTQTTDVAATAMMAVPVSAVRAERDAVVEAATAEAVRRKRGDNDPLRLARRIAAALNAPDSGDPEDFGFFWITGVTTSGAILVANSYGLAYIPNGVELPAPVQLVSADERIPAADRARWATYPVIALQGWALHHNTELRAVIATKEQLANSDPGTATFLLDPEDIPASGQMSGRSRLQMVDPTSAAQLAVTSDQRVTDLLPPRPADSNPPADRRARLWFNVMKPMTSRATGRETAHLRAFRSYVAHVQEIGLHEAYATVDPVDRRAAIADWLYWKYLNGLLDAALAEAN